jgi:hypothetical protein
MGRVLAAALFAVCVVPVLGTTGCGPIAYINQVSHSADEAVAAAKRADAATYAPYYWTLATQYLHEARAIAAHADFQGANRYGRLATEAADKAVVEANAAAKDPRKRPLVDDGAPGGHDRPKGIAPAKEPAPLAPVKDAP